ncbi:MAG: 16S rRNA (adenine(1518)-N(6)/adenine(1519)-N(6))-dimethyltransferase RsmA [bacterium]|nr:16S rRNA (adenine(1518)-N(6)/adenine(1519)-N(6))-dimethyltransferase RsmA [bacterium]
MSHTPQNRFGQHFLRAPGVLRHIIELGEIDQGDCVLEIGAGDGTLTRALLETGARVIAVEIDRNLIPVLREMEAAEENLQVVEGDAMQLDLDTFPAPAKVIANLPYQIASGLLSRICRRKERFPLLVVMVQREVGLRLTAPPGGKDYGSLTLWIGHHYEVELARRVLPGAFHPPPKVDSALMRLRARPAPPVEVPDTDRYFQLIRAAFAHRRKTLFNNLRTIRGAGDSAIDWSAILDDAGIDPNTRAETLEAEDFARIARALDAW